MGAIYGHGGQIDLQTVIICTNFQYLFYTRLRMMFEEISPKGFRGDVVQRKDRQTDGE